MKNIILLFCLVLISPFTSIAKDVSFDQRKANVERVSPLGDTVINGIEAVPNNGIGNQVFAAYIKYLKSDVNFKELDEALSKKIGHSAKNGYLLKDFIAGVNKYIARENMNLMPIRISGSNPQNKIKIGVPIFCWLAVCNFYNTDFLDRTKARASAASVDVWKKDLRKSEKRKFRKPTTTYSSAIICGFNKETDEYLVVGPAKSPIWLTEKEIAELILDAYVLR